MINRRAILLLALIYAAFGLMLLLGPVKAAESHYAPIGEYTCEDIRRAVALFPSQEAAIQAARAAGATEQQIEQARRCLNRD